MSKSPSALVQEKFGDKAKLVAALEPFTRDDFWVAHPREGKGLAHVSNAKLLHLYEVFTAVKAKFANRFKLVDAICDLEKRTKDEGFKKRLLKFPVPRLWDLYRVAVKRTARAEKTAASPRGKATAAIKAAASKPKKAAAAPKAKAAGAKAPAAKSPAKKAAPKAT